MFAEVRVVQHFVEFLERFGPICNYYGVDQERRAEGTKTLGNQSAICNVDMRPVTGYELEDARKEFWWQGMHWRGCE
jgi:hypothetical protein